MIKYIINYIKVWFHVYRHHCEEEKTYPWPEQISDHKIMKSVFMFPNNRKTIIYHCKCGYNEVK